MFPKIHQADQFLTSNFQTNSVSYINKTFLFPSVYIFRKHSRTTVFFLQTKRVQQNTLLMSLCTYEIKFLASLLHHEKNERMQTWKHSRLTHWQIYTVQTVQLPLVWCYLQCFTLFYNVLTHAIKHWLPMMNAIKNSLVSH